MKLKVACDTKSVEIVTTPERRRFERKGESTENLLGEIPKLPPKCRLLTTHQNAYWWEEQFKY